MPSGELLYYVGAVAVLYDKDADRQRHYTGHNEDIQRYEGPALGTVFFVNLRG